MKFFYIICVFASHFNKRGATQERFCKCTTAEDELTVRRMHRRTFNSAVSSQASRRNDFPLKSRTPYQGIERSFVRHSFSSLILSLLAVTFVFVLYQAIVYLRLGNHEVDFPINIVKNGTEIQLPKPPLPLLIVNEIKSKSRTTVKDRDHDALENVAKSTGEKTNEYSGDGADDDEEEKGKDEENDDNVDGNAEEEEEEEATEDDNDDDDESEKRNRKNGQKGEFVQDNDDAWEEEEDDLSNAWSWDDDNFDLNQLWHGRPTTSVDQQFVDLHKIRFSIILSHCLASLSWLSRYLEDFEFKNLTIVSKCGVQPNPKHLPKSTTIIQMDNVGRVDHTIAHWMAQVLPSTSPLVEENKEDIILFLKDNINVHTDGSLRSLPTLLNVTSTQGFGCALEPRAGKSFFHVTDILSEFYMEEYDSFGGRQNSPAENSHDVIFKSKYKNMGAWLQDMGILLPKPLSPVCYGGIFAVKRPQIAEVPGYIWRSMEKSLSRGDNIEEGHFAERTWAGLLFPRLKAEQVDLLIKRAQSFSHLNEEMRGALVKA